MQKPEKLLPERPLDSLMRPYVEIPDLKGCTNAIIDEDTFSVNCQFYHVLILKNDIFILSFFTNRYISNKVFVISKNYA